MARVKRSEGAGGAGAAGGKKKRQPLAQVTDLELDSVFGFRGFDCHNNLLYLNDGADVVYHAAGAGIVLNLSSGVYPNLCTTWAKRSCLKNFWFKTRGPPVFLCVQGWNLMRSE